MADLSRNQRYKTALSEYRYVSAIAFDDFCHTQEIRKTLASSYTTTKLPLRLLMYQGQPPNEIMKANPPLECLFPLSGRQQIPEPPDYIHPTADPDFHYMDYCYPQPTSNG